VKPPPPSPKTIRVLVAEDHGVVREGLVAMIRQQPDMEVVAQTGRAEDVVLLWRDKQPSVTLLDLQLGPTSGIEVITTLRTINPEARVLVLTTYDLEEDIYRCIRAGARGYLLKDISRLEMLDAIRRVHRGDKVLSPHIAAKLAQRVSAEPLTDREVGVLELVARGLANKELAAQLGITEATAKVHLKSIFSKLDVMSRTEAVHVARQRGLLRH
jgi:two-component system NarL family response regulator